MPAAQPRSVAERFPSAAGRCILLRSYRLNSNRSGTRQDFGPRMNDPVTKPATKARPKVRPKAERPRLYKVMLVNDDYTPREFVVMILKAEFGMTEDQSYKVMITAHQRGVCVVAVFTRDVAETKATRATDAARAKGYPLLFTTEPEE
jgi:ATP-dependent Clp protease adaptor protein ClpS